MPRFKAPPICPKRAVFIVGFFLVAVFIFFFGTEAFLVTELPSDQTPITFASTDTGQDLRHEILGAIGEAKESIQAIIYALGDRKVIQALNQKAEEGLDVSILFDTKASARSQKWLSPKIKKYPRKSKGLMHLKILTIDDRLTWIGTANFTPTSFRFHSNMMLGLYSKKLAQIVGRKIEKLQLPGKQKPAIPQSIQVGQQEVEVWFLPDNKGAVSRLINLINHAKESVRVAMYTWTRKDFVKAIIDASIRGVHVEVALDSSQARGASKEVVERLCTSGIALYLSQGDSLLHHKTAIIDNTLIVGSANWTKAAFTRNDDGFLVLEEIDPALMEKLDVMWQAILKRCMLADKGACG